MRHKLPIYRNIYAVSKTCRYTIQLVTLYLTNCNRYTIIHFFTSQPESLEITIFNFNLTLNYSAMLRRQTTDQCDIFTCKIWFKFHDASESCCMCLKNYINNSIFTAYFSLMRLILAKVGSLPFNSLTHCTLGVINRESNNIPNFCL